MHPLHESHCLFETTVASSFYEEDCCDDGTPRLQPKRQWIERHLTPSKPSLQTCDHGEKPLRIVVSVRKREVPTTAVVAFVRDVHDEADARLSLLKTRLSQRSCVVRSDRLFGRSWSDVLGSFRFPKAQWKTLRTTDESVKWRMATSGNRLGVGTGDPDRSVGHEAASPPRRWRFGAV